MSSVVTGSTAAEALTYRRRGDTLKYNLLLHKLHWGSEEELTPLFRELSSLSLSSEGEDGDVDEVVNSALNCSVDTLASSAEAFQLYHEFAMDVCTANATFVELCFKANVRTFALDVAQYDSVQSRAVDLVLQLLQHYPAAVRLLVDLITKRFPHQRRSADELRAYTRSMMRLVERSRSSFLTQRGLSITLEKVIWLDVESRSPDVNTTGGEDLRQVKLEAMLDEIFSFISRGTASTTSLADKPLRFDHLYSGMEPYLLNVQGLRYSPFVLWYACAQREAYMEFSVDRLREIFFDCDMAQGPRCAAVAASAGLLASLASAREDLVLLWTHSIAMYLHSYASSFEVEEILEEDAGDHELYYYAFGALMHVLSCLLPQIGSQGRVAERLRELRLARILRCTLYPLQLRWAGLERRFIGLLADYEITDGRDLLDAAEPMPSNNYTRRIVDLCEVFAVEKMPSTLKHRLQPEHTSPSTVEESMDLSKRALVDDHDQSTNNFGAFTVRSPSSVLST